MSSILAVAGGIELLGGPKGKGKGKPKVQAPDKKTKARQKVTKDTKSHANVDTHSRAPKSLQDEMTLEGAKKGLGEDLEMKLKDLRYKGMQKWEYKTKSYNGKDSVVHYVRDPKTGKLMDFKFTKHAID